MAKNKKTMLKGVLIISAFLIFCIVGLWIVDIPQLLEEIVNLPQPIQFISIIALIALQMILAFIPGEPIELAAGYMLGGMQGTLACLLGAMIGTLLVTCFVKLFRTQFVESLFAKQKIQEVEKILQSPKGLFWLFILFLLPGTPKDVMTYVIALGKIPLFSWLFLTTVGRLPSIMTSTFLCEYLRAGNRNAFLWVLSLTICFVLLGTILYKKKIQE